MCLHIETLTDAWVVSDAVCAFDVRGRSWGLEDHMVDPTTGSIISNAAAAAILASGKKSRTVYSADTPSISLRPA